MKYCSMGADEAGIVSRPTRGYPVELRIASSAMIPPLIEKMRISDADLIRMPLKRLESPWSRNTKNALQPTPPALTSVGMRPRELSTPKGSHEHR